MYNCCPEAIISNKLKIQISRPEAIASPLFWLLRSLFRIVTQRSDSSCWFRRLAFFSFRICLTS